MKQTDLHFFPEHVYEKFNVIYESYLKSFTSQSSSPIRNEI